MGSSKVVDAAGKHEDGVISLSKPVETPSCNVQNNVESASFMQHDSCCKMDKCKGWSSLMSHDTGC